MGQAFECDWCKGLYVGDPANSVSYNDTWNIGIGGGTTFRNDQLCEDCSCSLMDVRAKCQNRSEKP